MLCYVMLTSRNGHTGCIEEAGKRFATWIDSMEHYVPPNLRNLVYRYGMGARGDSAAWDEMLKRFMAEKNPAEKRKLLYGLGKKDEFALERSPSRALVTLTLLFSIYSRAVDPLAILEPRGQ